MDKQFNELWANRPWVDAKSTDKQQAEYWFNLGTTTRPADGDLIERVGAIRESLFTAINQCCGGICGDQCCTYSIAAKELGDCLTALQGVTISNKAIKDGVVVSRDDLVEVKSALTSVRCNGLKEGYFQDSVRWEVNGAIETLENILEHSNGR